MSKASQTLETIIRKLELWQDRNRDSDPLGNAGRAKSILIGLLNDIQAKAK